MTEQPRSVPARRQLMPGGVNSPVRAFKSVGGEPFFTERADGAVSVGRRRQALHRLRRLLGADGRSATPSGGARRGRSATRATACRSARPTGSRSTMAETIMRARAVARDGAHGQLRHRGDDGARSASRAATPAATKIVKFEGCYHGHGDALLVKAGSGALTFGVPTSPGVPKALADLTLTLPYNDLDAARELFAERRRRDRRPDHRAGRRQHELHPAARRAILQALRELCTRHGARADLRRSHDRISRRARRRAGSCTASRRTSPRSARSSAAACRSAPTAAAARSWQQIAPPGPIYQAGTLSGNPVAMAAGLAMLRTDPGAGFLRRTRAQDALAGRRPARGRTDAGVPFSTNAVCGMFGLFFTRKKWKPIPQATACDVPAFNRFFHAMLERGVYLAPSAFEAGFMSLAHSEQDIADTLQAAREAFRL